MINLFNILGVIGLASVTSLSGGLQQKNSLVVNGGGQFVTFKQAVNQLPYFYDTLDDVGDLCVTGWGINVGYRGDAGVFGLPSSSWSYTSSLTDYFVDFLWDDVVYSDLDYDCVFLVSYRVTAVNTIADLSCTWAFNNVYLQAISYRNYQLSGNPFKNFPKGPQGSPYAVGLYNFNYFDNLHPVDYYDMYATQQGNYRTIPYMGFYPSFSDSDLLLDYKPLSYGYRYLNLTNGAWPLRSLELSYADVQDCEFSWSISFNWNLPDNYQDGYDAGYQQGYNQGQSDGYTEGIDFAYPIGYQEAIDENSNRWYQSGYQAGYQDGASEDDTAYVIFTGIIDVGLLPVNVFLQILNFEVFGINIGALVSSFLTIAIVIILWRIISGGKNND